jgi:uncharacterized protein YjbI with pentapeptide repeats
LLSESNCLGHATAEEVSLAVERWTLGAPLDARGARISQDNLQLLLDILDRADGGSQAGPLSADRKPVFFGEVRFENAVFTDHADFHNVTFRGPAYFDGAIFEGRADFRRTEFLDHADFDNVEFKGSAGFRGAIFNDHAGFQNARAISEDVGFAAAKFRSYVDLEGAVFGRNLEMTEATFQLARRLGPFSVAAALLIDGCVFSERVSLSVRARSLSASWAVFPEGVRLSISDADLDFEGVDFGRASTVTSVPVPAILPLASTCVFAERESKRARLLTVHGAQVAFLSLSGLDLKDCRFFGAHGLESLNVEPSCEWRHTPDHWRCIDREMLAEEQAWRSSYAASRRGRLGRLLGFRLWGRSPSDRGISESVRLDPLQLAALYRALRKAREDNRDRAGSGDLYYGEMEMRRMGALPKGRGRLRAMSDQAIIRMYWMLSGYGLRAGRAFGSMVLVVLGGAFLFRQFGMTPEPSIPRALLFSFESACSLIRVAHLPQGYELRGSGEAVQVMLRLLGPVLLGLWLLALRSRVKR